MEYDYAHWGPLHLPNLLYSRVVPTSPPFIILNFEFDYIFSIDTYFFAYHFKTKKLNTEMHKSYISGYNLLSIVI